MLDSFVDLRASMTDEQIAEASGATVAAVAAWRLALDGPVAAPAVEAGAKPAKRAKKAVDDSAPPVTPAEPEAESAPACVRVTVSRVSGVRFPGKQFDANVTYKGIFSGAEAAFLWKHHRASVEPFPKV